MANGGSAPKETSFKSGLALDLGKSTLDFGKAMDGVAKKSETKNRLSSVPSPTQNINLLQQPPKAPNQFFGTGMKFSVHGSSS
jgi:hypothetical protein